MATMRSFPEGGCTRSHDQLTGSDAATWFGLCKSAVVEVTMDASGDQPAMYAPGITTLAQFLAASPTPAWTFWFESVMDFYEDPAHYSTVDAIPRPMSLIIRERFGMWVQAFAKDLTGGPVRFASNKGFTDPTIVAAGKKGDLVTDPGTPAETFDVVGGVFAYWEANGPAIMRKVNQDVAARCAGRPLVKVVDIAGAAMIFAEPVNQLFAIKRNMDDCIARGWTKAKHIQSFRDSWAMADEVWTPLGIHFVTSFNPGFEVTQDGSGNNVYTSGAGLTWSNALIDEMVDTYGGQKVIVQTKSFDGAYSDPAMKPRPNSAKELLMQDKMAGLRANLSLQTETVANLSNPNNPPNYTVKQVFDAAADIGCLWLEWPIGCQAPSRGADQITPAYARANSAKITNHPEKVNVVSTPTPVGGWLKGATGSSNNTATTLALPTAADLASTYPAGIPDYSTLILFAAGSASAPVVTGLSGVVGDPTPVNLGANPDQSGTTMPLYAWAIRVMNVDTGGSVTATWSPGVRGVIMGRVFDGADHPLTGFTFINAGDGTAGTVADQGQYGLIFAAARTASGSTVLSLSGTTSSDSIASTAGTFNVWGAIGLITGNGTTMGANSVTTDPDAQKVGVYVVSLASRTTVTKNVTTSWTVYKRVQSNRVTSWDAKASVTSSRATTWGTFSRVTVTRATSWTTTTPVTVTRATTWSTAAAIATSRATSWAVASSITKATATTWSTLAAVSAVTRATSWTTLKRAQTNRTTTWAVTSAVVKATATTWDTAATISPATRATSWAALTSVTSSRSTTWQTGDVVGGTTSVTTTRSSTWTTFAAATTIRSTTWSTAAAVTRARSTSWTTCTSATLTRATTWDTLAATAPTTRQTSWDTREALLVARAASWTTLTSAGLTRSTTWTTRSAVSTATSTSWSTRQSVTLTRDASWALLTSLTKAVITAWKVAAQTSKETVASWDTLETRSITRTARWDVVLYDDPLGQPIPGATLLLTTPTPRLELTVTTILTQGDTPILTGQCLSRDTSTPGVVADTPANLTGAVLRLHIKRPDATRTVITRDGILVDALHGKWTTALVAGDLNAAGTYLLEAEATYAGDPVQIQTFPAVQFKVRPQLG